MCVQYGQLWNCCENGVCITANCSDAKMVDHFFSWPDTSDITSLKHPQTFMASEACFFITFSSLSLLACVFNLIYYGGLSIPFTLLEISLVSFLHRSILSTGKNCWTEVTYFKDRTTHCTYQIALNRFFSLWWKAKKDCEDEDILISHFVRGWSGPDFNPRILARGWYLMGQHRLWGPWGSVL